MYGCRRRLLRLLWLGGQVMCGQEWSGCEVCVQVMCGRGLCGWGTSSGQTSCKVVRIKDRCYGRFVFITAERAILLELVLAGCSTKGKPMRRNISCLNGYREIYKSYSL
ncbi:hypothetical protein Bca4012_011091 [Brassica carinata]